MNDFRTEYKARQLPNAGTQDAEDPLAPYAAIPTCLLRAVRPFRVNGQLIEPGKCVDVNAEDAMKLFMTGCAERAE